MKDWTVGRSWRERGAGAGREGGPTGHEGMRRVADEGRPALDEGRLELHVDQIPELYAVVGSHVEHAKHRRREPLEVVHELLLARGLVITGQAFGIEGQVSKWSAKQNRNSKTPSPHPNCQQRATRDKRKRLLW